MPVNGLTTGTPHSNTRVDEHIDTYSSLIHGSLFSSPIPQGEFLGAIVYIYSCHGFHLQWRLSLLLCLLLSLPGRVSGVAQWYLVSCCHDPSGERWFSAWEVGQSSGCKVNSTKEWLLNVRLQWKSHSQGERTRTTSTQPTRLDLPKWQVWADISF